MNIVTKRNDNDAIQYIEFSYESLLAVFEMLQFRNALKPPDDETTDSGLTVIKDYATASADEYFKSVRFPPSIVREVQSAIVFHPTFSNEQKFLGLVDKYVTDESEMCVNISYKCRRGLLQLADSIVADFEIFSKSAILSPSIKVKYTAFDGCIRQLLRLMKDSLERFETTDQFGALINEIASLPNIEEDE